MAAMASSISHEDVLHLARLSHLQLTDDEASLLKEDLSAILTYIEQLSELDTDGIEPTYQVSGLVNVFRDDVVQKSLANPESLLALAPDVEKNQIKVPRVL